MVILNSTHQAVVAALQSQLAFLERQLVEVQRDRDFYRSHFTRQQVGHALPAYQSREERAASAADADAAAITVRKRQAEDFDRSLDVIARAAIADWASARFPEQPAIEAYLNEFGAIHPAHTLAE